MDAKNAITDALLAMAMKEQLAVTDGKVTAHILRAAVYDDGRASLEFGGVDDEPNTILRATFRVVVERMECRPVVDAPTDEDTSKAKDWWKTPHTTVDGKECHGQPIAASYCSQDGCSYDGEYNPEAPEPVAGLLPWSY